MIVSLLPLLYQLAAAPAPVRAEAIRQLPPQDQQALYLSARYAWRDLWARPGQLPPEEPWRYWYMIGGRGSGKTRPAAELVIEWAREPETRIALIGRDAGQGRKVMVDGESGIVACSPPWFRPKYLPSLKRLVWPNGSIGELHSANEPETLRGPQYHKAWAEELFHWPIPPKSETKEPVAWVEGLRYGLRLGTNPQLVATSTPRSSEFCHNLLLGRKAEDGSRAIQPLPKDHPDRYAADGFPYRWEHTATVWVDGIQQVVRSVIARWPTEDNRDNLAPGKPEEWRHEWGPSRLGQQELDGAILARAVGSLFSTDTIDEWAVYGVPQIVRTLVAVDPTRSNSPTDEAGIIVGGLGADGHGYVWDDVSMRGAPNLWAARALEVRNRYGATEIVYEKNRMPEMLKSLIRTMDPSCRWVEVFATEDKQTRAEPVSALYQQGRVHHVRDAREPMRLARLEDEMIAWDPKLKMPSPNRMDALVWLITALMLGDGPVRHSFAVV